MDPHKQGIIINHYLTVCSLLMLNENSNKRKRRRYWVRKIFRDRESVGDASNLVNEMFFGDHESFYNFCRMSREQFQLLLHKVGPSLSKTSIRKPISERDRLIVTLRFLATGMSYSSLSSAFRMGKTTVQKIIKETTEIMWLILSDEYIPKPNTEQLREISKQFLLKTGMPNCIGAIDGKHCLIQAPPHSGTLYHNYKKTFSVVLMAVCDSEYNFTYVNIGAYGSESDGGILRRSDFGHHLLNNNLQLPEDTELPGTSQKFPYYIVGDEAFPLKRNLLRPYGGRSLAPENEKFNKRLSTARRIIENAFGIMVSKFRIYHTVICASPEVANSIVKSTVVLHNFIRKTRPIVACISDIEATPTTTDVYVGNWTHRAGSQRSNHATHEAATLRDILRDYLNTI